MSDKDKRDITSLFKWFIGIGLTMLVGQSTVIITSAVKVAKSEVRIEVLECNQKLIQENTVLNKKFYKVIELQSISQKAILGHIQGDKETLNSVLAEIDAVKSIILKEDYAVFIKQN